MDARPLESAIRSACKLMDSSPSLVGLVPWKEVQLLRTRTTGPGQSEGFLVSEREPDAGSPLDASWKEVLQLPEVEAFQEWIDGWSTREGAALPQDAPEGWTHQTVRFVIGRGLNTHLRNGDLEAYIQDARTSLELAAIGGKGSELRIAPLANFVGEGTSPVWLPCNVLLRRLHEDELRWRDTVRSFFDVILDDEVPLGQRDRVQWTLEMAYSEAAASNDPQGANANFQRMWNGLSDTLSALRFANSRQVWIPSVANCFTPMAPPRSAQQLLPLPARPRVALLLPPYEVKKKEWAGFVSGISKTISALATSRESPLTAAAGRLNDAHNRWLARDAIVDLVIGIEALLLDDDEQGGFRLSLRGSALLGKTPGERTAVFEDLLEAYKWRSKIVHGEDYTPVKLSIDRLHELYREVSLEVIGRIASSGGYPKLGPVLDKSIVEGRISEKPVWPKGSDRRAKLT